MDGHPVTIGTDIGDEGLDPVQWDEVFIEHNSKDLD
jgi:hypothetical protein